MEIERICETCKKRFTVTSAAKVANGRGRFCSVKCRWDSRKEIRNCETCGKEFIFYFKRSLKSSGRFCSKICKNGGTLEQRFHRHIESGTINENGCIICHVYDGETYSKISYRGPKFAHRIAYELKHGEIPNGLIVLHNCDNPACVNVDHLFLGTQAENMADMVSKNRQMKGADHHKAKLTDEDVLEIRSRYNGKRGILTMLANEFGVRKQTISKIVKHRIWKHV